MYIYVTMNGDLERAEALSQWLPAELVTDAGEWEARKDELHLTLDEDGLSLRRGDIAMQGDFREMLPRLKQSNLEREMLVKASKPKTLGEHPTLLDATAGMGEDSLILAAAGFHVTLFEYDKIIAALLEDTMRRAAQIPELADIVARMELHGEDSIAAMNRMNGEMPMDVVLLDPMFPARTKSASIKKKFQLLQQLESPCSGEEELLQAAIHAAPKKIIIKRPLKGAFLAGIKPDYSLSGKAIRYDCLVNVQNRK